MPVGGAVEQKEARVRLLDAAERLFYERGVQAVGMDEIRAASGVSLKRLYQCFPSKGELVEGYLRRRDERWRADLADHVARRAGTAEAAPLAVFDWLHAWFSAPGYRGCAFINSFGELGATSDGVAAAARDHKSAVRAYVADLVSDLPRVDDPSALADQLLLLVDGAIATAAISGDPSAARHARAAAATLIAAAAR
ncbi:TetR/AcrR family transcriptional regulator [Kitasatospora sp. NPDC101183]|uniref:TetR/AcrR family transcriptional regulator n=1 Tax=Kitasatospora sp. NPDC101183 TaxID=3364100 RepID=UPI00382425EF